MEYRLSREIFSGLGRQYFISLLLYISLERPVLNKNQVNWNKKKCWKCAIFSSGTYLEEGKGEISPYQG